MWQAGSDPEPRPFQSGLVARAGKGGQSRVPRLAKHKIGP